MGKPWKVVIVAALVLGVAGVLVLKKGENVSGEDERSISLNQTGKNLPHLIDLGADKCIPCKMMAPILEDLRQEYRGKLEVTFIDVWKNPAPGRQYGIRAIPTQIFLDPTGKELFRHEGFFSREDILAKWQDLGISLR